MSNRYYQSENCAETINKEFSMAETFWPNKTNNATNCFSFQTDDLKFENELSDYPRRDVGEKCGEIFILNCSGDVVYSCQFCEDYFMNIGKLIHHCYDQHGFKDNRPEEALNKVLNKNKIDSKFLGAQNEIHIECPENDRETSNQNVNGGFVNNMNQINEENAQIDLQNSNLPKLIQTPSGQKYILVSTPVMNNNFAQQQHQPMHFQQPTQQTYGIVNPQYTNTFSQIPQNQGYIYNSPIHSGVQTTFVQTPPHNTNIGGASSERTVDENVQMTSFDNLIEFDSGSNSNQSPSNALHKEVGNTIEEIVANYPDEDNVLPPTTTEQFVITTEESSNQCAQTFQDHECGNSDIISGNKIEALIEELVNSNSNSQQNYISENENQTPIVLSGNNQQTLYVQNPAFFTTNVQSNPDTSLVNQHIITHQGQSVLLNNEGVQQNYIFDGHHLQPANFVNASNNHNHTSNLYIKFNENDGNIYLLNGFNNNLNINGLIESNNQIQISTQNEGISETVASEEISEEELRENTKHSLENNTSTSCEPIIHNFLNDSISSQNNQESIINKLSSNVGENQIVAIESNAELNNIQMQHVSAEEIVAGPSNHIHEQHIGLMHSDNDVNMQTDDQSSGPNLTETNEVNAMDTAETDTIDDSSQINIQNNQEKQPNDSFSKKKHEPKFLDNFQKFLENKREEEMAKEGPAEEDEDEAEKNSLKTIAEDNIDAFNKNYSCKICGRLFKEEFHLKLHNDRSPPVKCEECNLLFCSSKLFYKHTKSHANDQTPVIKCDLCSLTFRSQHFLEMHMKNHNDVRPFKCNICKSSFRFQRYLDLHMNRHLGKKPYPCNFCEKCFFTGNERAQHEAYHVGRGCTFKCKICEKEFGQRTNLVNHLRTHNSGKLTSTIKENANRLDIFDCKICNEKFNTFELLHKHQTSHTLLENIANSNNSLSINNENKVLIENYNQNESIIRFSNNIISSNNDSNSISSCNSINSSSNNIELDQISTMNKAIDNELDNTLLINLGETSSTGVYLNCEHCGNKFLNNDLLNEHSNYCYLNSNNNAMESSSKCRKCNLILRNSNELSNHLNRHCCVEEEIDVVL